MVLRVEGNWGHNQELPKYDHTEHEHWLEQILINGVNLTPKEEDFVEDIDIKFKSGEKLVSRKQELWLESIYTERTP